MDWHRKVIKEDCRYLETEIFMPLILFINLIVRVMKAE